MCLGRFECDWKEGSRGRFWESNRWPYQVGQHFNNDSGRSVKTGKTGRGKKSLTTVVHFSQFTVHIGL